MNTNIHKIFLWLVRLGIGHAESAKVTEISGLNGGEWEELKALADRQGLSALVLDGLGRLTVLCKQSEQVLGRAKRPLDLWSLARQESRARAQGSGFTVDIPKMERLQWIGEVLQNYEGRFEAYRKAIGSLAGWYNAHGFRMMVLKGYACALDWPKPEHRPTGDIDVWLFGKQKFADAVLLNDNDNPNDNFSIDTSHHHHTVFDWEGFMVENHYDFINVHHHRSNGEYEKILKELGADDSHSVEVCGERVYLPSANLHALFLIKHMMLHFASGEITLRQLLDWAFFVEKHGGEVDWPMVLEVFDRFGMRQLFDIFNAICVEDLGFAFNYNERRKTKDEKAPKPPKGECRGDDDLKPATWNLKLKERVLNEILSPEFSGDTPSSLIPRLAFKYRRWKANGWKHKLCYRESMWSAFWSGVWNHLLKPASI